MSKCKKINRVNKDPSFLLMYPPQQFAPGDSIKPDGSLGLAYLAGSLRQNGYEVKILDACVGNDNYTLDNTFFNEVQMENGLVRIGMAIEDILKECEHYDVIGITSIFTPQTKRIIEVIRALNENYPEKLIVLGGVNARSQMPLFFGHGADIICLSEAEGTILEIGETIRRGSLEFSHIDGIALKNGTMNHMKKVENDLDNLPVPAFDMLPHKKYWEIERPRGGKFDSNEEMRFASVITSRGCPFSCNFCHISLENTDDPSGDLRKLRFKSKERVLHELEIVKEIGAKHIFFEDDSILAKKPRALRLFRAIKDLNLVLRDINGVNIKHLFKKINGKLQPDEELIEAMVEAGFTELSLPFESGSERILKKYASNKYDLRLDTIALVKLAKKYGLLVSGGFMIGFPDETYDEMTSTIMLAKKHVDNGLDIASLRCTVPYPGSKLHQYALDHDHLDHDFDPDIFVWLNPTMKNTIINNDVLKYVNKICWEMLNPSWRLDQIKSMAV